MSGSKTIIDGDLLPNPHPGEFLREDFLIGSEIDPAEVAEGAGIALDRLRALMDEAISVDADIDLRLGRYFGMSEGFFLGLQIDFDLEEARRTHGAELDRIVRRAA
jgi:addiction module HigA family antidote